MNSTFLLQVAISAGQRSFSRPEGSKGHRQKAGLLPCRHQRESFLAYLNLYRTLQKSLPSSRMTKLAPGPQAVEFLGIPHHYLPWAVFGSSAGGTVSSSFYKLFFAHSLKKVYPYKANRNIGIRLYHQPGRLPASWQFLMWRASRCQRRAQLVHRSEAQTLDSMRQDRHYPPPKRPEGFRIDRVIPAESAGGTAAFR